MTGALLLLAGCSADASSPSTPAPPAVSSAPTAPTDPVPTSPSATPSPTATASPSPSARPSPTAAPRPARVDADRVLRDIETLAVDIGPREATSRRYARAADWVERRLTSLGYRVRRETVRVPAGVSWGVPVRAGTSVNLIAERPGFDREAGHVVVGAHLDTVPQAPGAEDNASGVAVLLELARLAAAAPPEVPVRFLAFGAEEPRGPGDALHHFGSQQHVAKLSRAERDAIAGMLALDRVGVRADYVPVCQGGPDGTRLRTAVRRAGSRADITTRACENRTSDHWSYEKAGIPAVRIGSIPYAGYHSRRDVPSVVSRDQLDRVGRLIWAWLN
jgi:acetylornithine deacetylase/succinyl-diaminopimelate desuccinylase-like protein